ncbi:early growth response protein 1 (egr-1), partial [Colletotrichum asianum]
EPESPYQLCDLRKRHVRKYHPGSDSGAEQPPPSVPPIETLSNSANSHGTTRRESSSTRFISAYFENFQPIFPLIHAPTFDLSSAKEPLLQAIACIGAVYQSPDQKHECSAALFDSGLKALDVYVRERRCSRFQEVWVMQAYLLFEYYAIHCCDDGRFSVALKIHRKVVDASRQYQLLQDRFTLGLDESFNSPKSIDNTAAYSTESAWHTAIQNESRKRIAYCLYYLDAQLAICCNMRPLLAALEIKYELRCRDDIWEGTTAEDWQALVFAQDGSFNEEEDEDANAEPRPAHGDLYGCLARLMNPDPSARGRPPGLLWQSSFTCLVLIIQILMMTRDLTLAGSFLYHNIRPGESKNNLSIISEVNRAPIMQALDSLADLMRKPSHDLGSSCTNSASWDRVWTINMENILMLMSRSSRSSLPGSTAIPNEYATCSIIEDPFMTMVGFKACLMGWRLVRLMSLTVAQSNVTIPGARVPSIYAVTAQVLAAINSDDNPVNISETPEARYLTWVEANFASQRFWPLGKWIVAVFND